MHHTSLKWHSTSTTSTQTRLPQEQRNILILQLDKDILNTNEDINEQILAMQAKILVLQTRRAPSHSCSPKVYCQQFIVYLFEIFGIIFIYATRDRPRHV